MGKGDHSVFIRPTIALTRRIFGFRLGAKELDESPTTTEYGGSHLWRRRVRRA